MPTASTSALDGASARGAGAKDVGPHIVPLIEAAHAELLAEIGAAVRTALSYERAARLERVARQVSQHGFAEEVAIFSVLAAGGEGPMASGLIDEHRELARRVAAARRWARWWPFARRPLHEVERLAAEHFSFVENVALVLLQASQPEEKLHMMGAWYDRARRLGPTRPHPHAPRSTVALLGAGPVMSLFDHARERLCRAVGL